MFAGVHHSPKLGEHSLHVRELSPSAPQVTHDQTRTVALSSKERNERSKEERQKEKSNPIEDNEPNCSSSGITGIVSTPHPGSLVRERGVDMVVGDQARGDTVM